MTASEKYIALKEYLAGLGGVAVAFSGGVDSTFLLKTAHGVLGDRAVAVTARSRSFPKRELDEALAFCETEKIRHIVCDTEEFKIEGFMKNPADRCYLCKREIFGKLRAAARGFGTDNVAEGSNLDDERDYRPGMKAVAELGVLSPLRTAGLYKEEIRLLSRELGLPSWNKPTFACLVSRFPYGEELSVERIDMIDRAEQFLLDSGFIQVRVRYHGDLARIECDEAGFLLLEDKNLRKRIYAAFKEIGFAYVASDLLGYRAGSMNETLGVG